MAYNTSVKYFHSGMTGAPSLTGSAGALLAVLNACLVNGFGSQTATSVSVSGGIATMTVPSTHPFDVHTVVLVAGATPSGLNGEKRVLTKSTYTITFDATGIADGLATGTITVKLAPAGWNQPFSGTNVATYQSANAASTKAILRVDDTASKNARVVAYESMTDIDTGTGACPRPWQQAGGLYWPKANATGGTGRFWIVIADDKTVWLKVGTNTTGTQNNGIIFGAGDFASRKVGDTYSFAVFGATADYADSAAIGSGNHAFGLAYPDQYSSFSGFALRASTGIGAACLASKRPESFGVLNGSTYESGNGLFPYPNPSDNSLLLCRFMLSADVGGQYSTMAGVRGYLRGPFHCPQLLPSTGFSALTLFDEQGDLAGRKLMAVNGNTPASNVWDGRTVFFDVTGPWE